MASRRVIPQTAYITEKVPLAWRRAIMFLLLPLWLPLLAIGFVGRFAWLFMAVGWDALDDFIHWINVGNDD